MNRMKEIVQSAPSKWSFNSIEELFGENYLVIIDNWLNRSMHLTVHNIYR